MTSEVAHFLSLALLWLVVFTTQRRVAKLERRPIGALELGEHAASPLDRELSRIYELTGKVPIAVGSRRPGADFVHWRAHDKSGARWVYSIPWRRHDAPDDAPAWHFQGEPRGTWHTLEQLEAAAAPRRRM